MAGQGFDRQRAAANLAAERCGGHLESAAHGALQQRRQRLGLRLHVGRRAGEQAQRGQARAQLVGRQVQAQHGFERSQGELADAQRALQGVGLDFGNQLLAAHDQTGLRTTQQLVTAEGHQVGAGSNGFAHRHFVRQAPWAQVHQRAAAQVHHQRQVARVGDGRHLAVGHAFGEPGDRVVAAMHLHQQGGVLAHGAVVVARVRAVGGAHFHQLCAGAGHHVGNAKGAANLHQFAARNDHLPARRQAAQHQQHGGGVVVDHGGGFGAGQFAQQRFHQVVAVAAPAGGQVVFQVHRRGHGLHHRCNGFGRQQGAPQVGVQHRAGEVEHRAQPGRKALGQRGLHRLRDGVGRQARRVKIRTFGPHRTAQPGQHAAHRLRAGRGSMRGLQALQSGVLQHPVHRRQRGQQRRAVRSHCGAVGGCRGAGAHASALPCAPALSVSSSATATYSSGFGLAR